MKILEFKKLFEKIRELIKGSRDDEKKRHEAIKQLNIMGEELIKAEESMDKFRSRVDKKRKELQEALAITGAPIGNETPRALEKTLQIYEKKFKKIDLERNQLRREYDVLDDQLRAWKSGEIPEKMRFNLESLTREEPRGQIKGPKNFKFYI